MKKQKILNKSEILADDILSSVFNKSEYRIFRRISLSKVLLKESGERIQEKDRNFLEKAEFDFVVTNVHSDPVFAIEFDGPKHRTDKKQIERDIRKNRLCNSASFPLFRITSIELEEFEKCSILEWIMSRYLAWQNEIYEIHNEIAEYWESLDEIAQKSLTEGGFLDPSIDPSFIFDLRYPFPGTKIVAERLLNKYKITNILVRPQKAPQETIPMYSLFCDVFKDSSKNASTHDIICSCKYYISLSSELFKGDKSHFCKEDRESSILLKEGSVRFQIRCTLPIVEDYDPEKESIADYYFRTKQFPVSFQELPGVSSFSIAENIAEYLGYREVERWAEENC